MPKPPQKQNGSIGFRRKSIILLITNKDVKKALGVLRLGMDSDDPDIQVKCSTYLLDQRFGKAPQAVKVGGDGDEPIMVKIWK